MTKEWPKILPRKPLVEAIIEIRWGQEMQPDPAYPIIVGRLYEQVRAEYGEIEDLPFGQIPAELTVHMARHRFRKSKGGWPLIQIGPGVFTFNETEGYRRDDFSRRAKELLPKLFQVHPSPESLKITSVQLRYINAHPVGYPSENILTFLSKKMKTVFTLPQHAFERTKVGSSPVGLMIQSVFPMQTPPGVLKLRFGTGKNKDKPSLVWDIEVQSSGEDVPKMPEGFNAWLDAAHTVAENWFFELVEGELLDGYLKP